MLGNFEGWLVRIVVNASYDLLRLRKRYTILSLDRLQEELNENDESVIDRSELPEAYSERHELNQLIRAGINELHSEHRTILVFADIYGYSYQEISEMMGWPLGTVKSKLSRARANLRTYLLEHPDLLPLAFQPPTA
jgi:RNA polymerase sigma-70 factor, ECF subfamily